MPTNNTSSPHQNTGVGNSIYTGGQGEALPHKTQSKETITREGGRQRRKQRGGVLPPGDLQVKDLKVLTKSNFLDDLTYF